MKMSYFDKVEIPYFKDAIILFFKGQYYGKKGYYHDKSERIKK